MAVPMISIIDITSGVSHVAIRKVENIFPFFCLKFLEHTSLPAIV